MVTMVAARISRHFACVYFAVGWDTLSKAAAAQATLAFMHRIWGHRMQLSLDTEWMLSKLDLTKQF